MSISVIIPVYNEETHIENTITEIHKTLKNSSIKDYEIIVVDDGSTDNTTEILKKSNLDFKLIRHEQNKGYGSSLKCGIRRS
nr:glycosyltransferase [Candidatus Aminicenantes bacterium]NIM80075.1 glycosyltransferase [Candidatus Aminicenantes bacterium]NIN19418.1 glycosyltransferase [Candidatus Aminicenantes bacterium]NIN43317.1 glycosyltransferase [Candidatus Aminicenantes bacterium]NIN86061.1 glycosyltransferase [Candidatus Aminicenantes bacterium]